MLKKKVKKKKKRNEQYYCHYIILIKQGEMGKHEGAYNNEHCTGTHSKQSDAVCGLTMGFCMAAFSVTRPFNEIIIMTSVVSTAAIMLAFKQ